MKNARTVVIVTVASVSLSVIQFLAVNGFGDGAEIPRDPPLTVQFLLSLLAQLVLRDKSGHDHHSLPMAYLEYNTGYHTVQGRDQKNIGGYCPTVAPHWPLFPRENARLRKRAGIWRRPLKRANKGKKKTGPKAGRLQSNPLSTLALSRFRLSIMTSAFLAFRSQALISSMSAA